MNRIKQVFGRSRVLLPVIHPTKGRTGALASVQIARDAGADGVFLIDQGMNDREVLDLLKEVRGLYPGWWVGLNLLSRGPVEALRLAVETCGVDGIWSDNAGVDERTTDQARADVFVKARGDWQGLYFGGVAFKYQREVAAADLPRTTKLASHYMDVICTSGPGTGHAADPTKVKTMRSGVSGDVAISLASGVTVDNVQAYLPYVDAYLVGTGIEHEVGVLNPPAVAALAKAIHAFDR
ncbi:MAG: BtpA/SgcQ family protein [Kofleriaceae bacterium]